MTQGIVIVTSGVTSEFYPDCLVSAVNDKYPLLVHYNEPANNEFEMGGIKTGMRAFDEFLLLHDTSRLLKARELYDIVFEQFKGKSVSFGKNFFMYLGKYRTEVLRKMEIPDVKNKDEAIYHEWNFAGHYINADGDVKELWQDFKDNRENYKQHHGRWNLIIQNPYIIKYKANGPGITDGVLNRS